MWISKKGREMLDSEICSLMRERDEWKAKYLAATEGKAIYANKAAVVSQELLVGLTNARDMTKRELERVIKELEKYKQKYADEVQKRLALIEQTKG